ncbi:hypothetical protein SISNIDRAFT_459512 [Sistotremastrum niveocremeum HHB9708]|uniref:Zn(2)-C6 fungal-type domain-containing protein n=1 Tax=Sistotremastrum niveocremeum HHB9708 TaxID=1314777 RepID=A0A164PFH9_9AGAM|nr:hypothetical protein SISNIDRAFT_459512 [Sistotremastrum niveocremeum HHB9708]
MDADPSIIKRGKSQLACHECRRRKIKCYSNPGRPCIHCTEKRIHCQYDDAPRRRGQGRKPKLERLRRMQARGERDDLYAPESSTSSLTPLSSEYTPLPQLSPHEAFVPKVSSSPSPPPYIPSRPLPSASTSFENHSRDIELILLKNEIGELQSRNEHLSRQLEVFMDRVHRGEMQDPTQRSSYTEAVEDFVNQLGASANRHHSRDHRLESLNSTELEGLFLGLSVCAWRTHLMEQNARTQDEIALIGIEGLVRKLPGVIDPHAMTRLGNSIIAALLEHISALSKRWGHANNQSQALSNDIGLVLNNLGYSEKILTHTSQKMGLEDPQRIAQQPLQSPDQLVRAAWMSSADLLLQTSVEAVLENDGPNIEEPSSERRRVSS